MIFTKKHIINGGVKSKASRKPLRLILTIKAFVCLLLYSVTSIAQEQNYKEDLIVNINANQHFVGETIHFTVFSISAATRKPSSLSRYAYVQLIGKDGVIAQQKLELTSSSGSGEFFIPSTLATGRYYILAYTRWMKNFNDYATTSLNIINPYLPYEDALYSIGNERNVDFRPIAGKITAGIKNRVAFKISDENGLGVKDKGRLVDSNGALIKEVYTDQNGLGTFVFTPIDSIKYQLVLTDENNDFLFFGLPNVSNKGMGVFVKHSESSIQIELKAVNQPMAEQLRISRNGQIVYQENLVSSTQTLTLRRDELPKDILSLSLWNASGEKELEYPLINNWTQEGSYLGEVNERQEVSVRQFLEKGYYNISVRKVSNLEAISSLKLPTNNTSVENDNFDYLETDLVFYDRVVVENTKDSIIYLPELKSELMEGRVTTSNGQAAVDKTVILTVGNETYNLVSTYTDSEGHFLLEYVAPYGKQVESYLTVYDFDEDYLIQLNDNYLTNLPELDFSPIRLDSGYITEIIERSINSQLENAYFIPSVDSVASNIAPVLISSDFANSYNFDDYTRFETVEEHFIEYIAGSRVRKRQEDAFIVSSPYLELDFYNTPLILLDGVPVDARAMLDFSPYRIQSVDLVNTLFFLQSTPFDGVINFKTIEGNLDGFKAFKNSLSFSLDGPKRLRTTPSDLTPGKSENDRIPDQRIQLLWQPGLNVDKARDQSFSFKTSDISGNFEVSIKGVTADGIPVSIIRKLKVKKGYYD